MANEIMVSIDLTTFNHERYLRRCLDSLLAQKTNFKFEILLHDDASTDGTVQIINEYNEKYPEIFNLLLQTENQYSKDRHISLNFQAPRAEGKYIAHIEGDDFWTDEYKLQKQFDFMEAHPDCSVCTHKVNIYSNKNDRNEGTIPNYELNGVERKIIGVTEYLEMVKRHNYIFQTSSFFVRADVEKNLAANQRSAHFLNAADVYDEPLLLHCIASGHIAYIGDVMSSYRAGQEDNWNADVARSAKKQAKHHLALYNMFNCFDEYTKNEYGGIIKKIKAKKIFNYLFTCKLNGFEIEDEKALKKQLSFKQKTSLSCKIFKYNAHKFIKKIIH